MTSRLIEPALTLALVGWLFILLIWLGLEENSVESAVVLGHGLTVLWLGRFVYQRWGGRVFTVSQIAALSSTLGAVMGSFGVVASAGIMFFKSAWHNHLVPDYPLALILALFAYIPAWILVGAFFGFGVFALWRAFAPPAPRR